MTQSETPEAGVVEAYWLRRVEDGELTPHTAARYLRIWAAFQRFASAMGEPCADLASAGTCRAFIVAAAPAGQPPAAATSRFRLTVLRDAFIAVNRAVGGVTDPTEGLRVQQVLQTRSPAPLTPSEFARLRAAGRLTPRDHIRPAIVELAAAGGNHEEIARVTVAAIDLTGDQVLLTRRWVHLDPFAAAAIRARVADCRLRARRRGIEWAPATTYLCLRQPLSSYPATSIAPGLSSSISRAMKAAGLARPGLRPASVREYGANRTYALTGRVESVAEFLGIASLDAARKFIDRSWQEVHGEEVRDG